MADFTKLYFHDAVSPNTGTLPVNTPCWSSPTFTGDATGAATCRDATEVIGTANPDVESTITSLANSVQQCWGHRRFLSRPLASQTINSGNWVFSYARTESSLNHNMAIGCTKYFFRPSTGLVVGSVDTATGTEPSVAAAEQTHFFSINENGITIVDGDIVIFDVWSLFTQSMSTAYTDQFAYDGTTEGSTTACASNVGTPGTLPITFSTGAAAPTSLVADTRRRRNSNLRRCIGRTWDKRPSGIFVPKYT
jgi:hypothetical protein